MGPADRSLKLVATRLHQLGRERRRPSKAADRRIRSLELVLAACITEAAVVRREQARGAERPPSAPHRGTDAGLRGAWERPR